MIKCLYEKENNGEKREKLKKNDKKNEKKRKREDILYVYVGKRRKINSHETA